MAPDDVRLKNLVPIRPGEPKPGNTSRLGSPHRSTIFKQWTGTKVLTQDVNGNEVTLTVEDAIVIAQCKKAIAGDTAAAVFIMEGKYGKVKEVKEQPVTPQLDYSRLTPEQLAVIRQAQDIFNGMRNGNIEDAHVVG